METMSAGFFASMPNPFKSYYVVWKHIPECVHHNRLLCLNRTMQYGNEYQISAVAEWGEV